MEDKSHPSDYKQYLRSCDFQDISPRVLRRLNYGSETRAPNLVSIFFYFKQYLFI